MKKKLVNISQKQISEVICVNETVQQLDHVTKQKTVSIEKIALTDKETTRDAKPNLLKKKGLSFPKQHTGQHDTQIVNSAKSTHKVMTNDQLEDGNNYMHTFYMGQNLI